jgi:alkylation response protein AidB-like acyl-CoA dehydrogenase
LAWWLDKGKGEYVLNGRKYWPCNSGGWDLKGADVNVVIVRTAPSEDGKQGLSGMLVPRGARGMRFERPISKIGHRLCQNNDIVFENCRVPEEERVRARQRRPDHQQGLHLVGAGGGHRRGRGRAFGL